MTLLYIFLIYLIICHSNIYTYTLELVYSFTFKNRLYIYGLIICIYYLIICYHIYLFYN